MFLIYIEKKNITNNWSKILVTKTNHYFIHFSNNKLFLYRLCTLLLVMVVDSLLYLL